MTIADLTTFLGWATVINFGLLLLATLSIATMRGMISGVHSRLFGLKEEDLTKDYFSYLANFKILVLVLNFTPYIVLRFLM